MKESNIDIDRIDSCELSINAKGLYSGKVKVYAEHAEDAMFEAKRLAEQLRKHIKEVNQE